MYTFRDKFEGLLPDRISGLGLLAMNLWWSWRTEARNLFKMLNRPAWKMSVHNPVKMLRGLDRETLEQAAADPKFLRHYDAVMAHFETDLQPGGGWFFSHISSPWMQPVVFFSPEYGLHHSLPLYAGGLGFLAGDYLKECSDLDIPMVAVGYMYPEGYLRQRIAADGWQTSTSETVDRENAPVYRLLDESGNRLVVRVPVLNPPILVEVWRVQVGRVSLFLIDTDIEDNDPWNRAISSHLYAGDPEQRLRQEIVLGIGGAETLRALGVRHSLLHLNEGHSAFAILERIRERIEAGMGYEQAAEQVKSTTVFTTHTPVPAGHDVFPFPLVEKYFSSYLPALGLDRDSFFQLGLDPANPAAGFNMTAFALRMSGYHNGVSRKHGAVARRMWPSLWPDSEENHVRIDYITNGIHVPTWIEPKMELLFNKYLGSDWPSDHDDPDIWGLIDDIPDAELWETHQWLKMKLILKIMEKARNLWLEDSADPRIILASGVLLDPNALTLGFARRFATYKRAGLILSNMERLKKMVNDRWRPVQIIFAGKAHPDDNPAKMVLQQVFNAAKDPSLGGRIAFVEDYDEQMAQYLVHGVDVWLNNPLPPFEACGTSGMKASLNGVPHLSVLDGWWPEGFNGKNGWAFGGDDRGGSDAADAEALYTLLEQEIVPLYYKAGDSAIPHGWVQVMKEAIKSTAPVFSTRRMIKQYVANVFRGALR